MMSEKLTSLSRMHRFAVLMLAGLTLDLDHLERAGQIL
jgi:hypothetical protein